MTIDKDKIINQLIGLIDHSDTSGRVEWCQGWLRDSLVRQGFWVPIVAVRPVYEPSVDNPPVFEGVICKGDKSLNSHCGKCEKCRYFGWTKSTGGCKERSKPGGCQLHSVNCRYPTCDNIK